MVLNPAQPASEPLSDEILILYVNFVNELHAHVDKLKKQVKEVEQSYQSIDVLLPKVVHTDSELSQKEALKQLGKKIVREALYVNKARKLSTEMSKVNSAIRILEATLIARSRKLSSTEISLLANAITRLSPEKASQVVNENSSNLHPSLETVSLGLDFQNDYILWRLHKFVKNSLQA